MKLNDITRGTGLEADGISNANLICWIPPTSVLYTQIVKRGEGLISHLGAVAVKTKEQISKRTFSACLIG